MSCLVCKQKTKGSWQRTSRLVGRDRFPALVWVQKHGTSQQTIQKTLCQSGKNKIHGAGNEKRISITYNTTENVILLYWKPKQQYGREYEQRKIRKTFRRFLRFHRASLTPVVRQWYGAKGHERRRRQSQSERLHRMNAKWKLGPWCHLQLVPREDWQKQTWITAPC